MERTEYIHERFGGQCKKGDVAPTVLVPGSEKRAEQFASLWEEAWQVAHHYSYLVLTGRTGGVPVSACSTGCGGRSVSIAVDELAELGATTFIRAGVSGAIQPWIKVGDLIIASGAVRMDRTSEHYVFLEYPAVADLEITCALVAAAQKLGCRYHVGISASPSSFYLGEGAPGFRGYEHSNSRMIRHDLREANVLDFDNETATLFTLTSLYGLRAGRVNTVVDDDETRQYMPVAEDNMLRTVLEAVKILNSWEREKERKGWRYVLPRTPSTSSS